METAYSNQPGWISDRQNSTGTSSCLKCITKYVLVAGLFVSAGTGVFADDLSRLRQERKNEPIISNPIKIYTVETKSERTSAEDMAQIRKVFSPAVSDLAKSFNVSRQTIYNWLNEEQPTPEHTARLRDLALVADMFAEAGVPANGVLLKRRMIKGKNLFDIIREGGSARDAAQLLLQIVQSETRQRERLAARFAGRKVSQPSADSDIMAANDPV